ncbi:hypothetical protein [Curtobacterium herbarum]|uniref:Asp23/Gls24 family envelope stress response protein n=1 Tax=Curtobacterium herbarum TaxID=150122 RepID=A0ABN1ZE87_9MICO|nr:hypothetical protein [Curtobacterium herbarum]MBM7474737.1 putative alkaline shock family protein YloU [Curtobacterium herbarum]MCS6545387.1 hypothetical protein [Curtobacterium herbarum]
MTAAPGPHEPDLAALEPEDLDGHTIDELADYLDAGMVPADPTIDDSPACQNALAAIMRLRHASLGSLDEAAKAEAPADESWIGGVLANISFEVRAGRDIPLRAAAPTEHPVMTEGAVRSLVRRAGDEVPGVVVSRCVLDGDVTELASPVRVSVEIAVVAGHRIVPTADAVRLAVEEILAAQTDLTVEAVDVLVRDLIAPQTQTAHGVATADGVPTADSTATADGSATSGTGTGTGTDEEAAR